MYWTGGADQLGWTREDVVAGSTAQKWSQRNVERHRQRAAPTAVAKGEMRKSGDTRERIMEAAIAALAAGGYHNLTVAGVATRAGLTRAAAIYHFPSREALLEAIVTYLLEKRARTYWEAVRHIGPGPDQIRRYVDLYWEQVDSDLFAAFAHIFVASKTDSSLEAIVRPGLARFEADRAHYSRLIFADETRRTSPAFDTIRDVARFTIEGMGFEALVSRPAPRRIAAVKAFVTAQMEAAYLTGRPSHSSDR
jgi:AcrR family transcriptional regulator